MTEEQKEKILQEFLKTQTIKEFQSVCQKHGFVTFADVGEKIGVDAIIHFNSLSSAGSKIQGTIWAKKK